MRLRTRCEKDFSTRPYPSGWNAHAESCGLPTFFGSIASADLELPGPRSIERPVSRRFKTNSGSRPSNHHQPVRLAFGVNVGYKAQELLNSALQTWKVDRWGAEGSGTMSHPSDHVPFRNGHPEEAGRQEFFYNIQGQETNRLPATARRKDP